MKKSTQTEPFYGFSWVPLGGDSGNRTHDLLNAIQALYQLSYIPILFIFLNLPRIAMGLPRFGNGLYISFRKDKNLRGNFPRRFLLFFVGPLLLAFDGADRASFFARTAIDANVRIDLVLRISLGNRVHRAGFGASAAGDAIFGNFMCHDHLPPKNFDLSAKSPLHLLLYHKFLLS